MWRKRRCCHFRLLSLEETVKSLFQIMSNKYEMDGKVKVVFDTQTFGSGFQKREFVITTADDKYPQDIKFEVLKEKCEMLDSLKSGQSVKVSFDIRGNEYKDRFYVNLNAWKIDASDGGGSSDDRPASIDDANADSYVDAEDEPF